MSCLFWIVAGVTLPGRVRSCIYRPPLKLCTSADLERLGHPGERAGGVDRTAATDVRNKNAQVLRVTTNDAAL